MSNKSNCTAYPMKIMDAPTSAHLVGVVVREELVFLRFFSLFALKSLYSQDPCAVCLVPKRKRREGGQPWGERRLLTLGWGYLNLFYAIYLTCKSSQKETTTLESQGQLKALVTH